MSQDVQDKLLDHEYDGIREYDNPTPGWWVMLFALTIIFSAFYVAYYYAPVADRSIYDAYTAAKTDQAAREEAAIPGELNLDSASLAGYLASERYVAMGRAVFKNNCVSCHASEGQGQQGPNLTDQYYKHVKALEDIPQVVTNGANNGKMPSWKNALSRKKIALVSVYVASLRGKNLPGPRLEGDGEIAPWPAAPAASSVPASVPAAR